MIGSLSGRERGLLGIGGITVAAALGWTLLWQPLSRERGALSDRIAAARTVLVALDTYPEGTAAAPAPVQEAPIATRVTRSAEAAGVALTRIEPAGDGLAALVDEASFDAVIGWIADMEATGGLRLRAIEIGRRPVPGVVSARLDLETAR